MRLLAVAVVTAYALGDGHTPDHGITASGVMVRQEITVAADTNHHPFGSLVWIEGVGVRRVEDRGGAIRGPDRFDVYFPSIEDARVFGIQRLRYKVLEDY